MMAKRAALLAIGLLFIGTVWAKDIVVTSYTSTAIQNAYTTLKDTVGNHRVLLQEGVYNLASTIVCDVGVAGRIRILPYDTTKRPILKIQGKEVFSILEDSVSVEGLELITDQTAIRILGKGTAPSARGVTISRCHIHGPAPQTMSIGIWISKGDSAQADGATIVNNLITDVATKGIQVITTPGEPALTGLKLYHNTILMDKNTSANWAVYISGALNANASFVNNALYFSDSAHIQIVSGGASSYNIGATLYDISRTGATPFLPMGGTGGFIFPGGAVFASNPFASYGSIYNSAGRPLVGSPAIDAGTALGISTDLYGRPRGSKPDVGAIEYLLNYSDTIYVSPTGNDSAKGDRGRPVRTMLHAFQKKVPDTLRYPAVIRMAAGTYPPFSLTGKTVFADTANTGAVWVVNEDDQFTNRPVVTGSGPQAIEIQGNSIHVEGLAVRVSSGIGILVKGGSRAVGIHRCFIRPEVGGTMSKAVEISSSAGAINGVRVENCLIDYKEYTGSSGAIVVNSQTNAIDAVYILYNTIFLEDRSGEAGLRLTSLTSKSISNLEVLYNIFDSPKRAAIVIDNPCSSGVFLKNFNFNSPLDTVLVDGSTAGILSQQNRHVDPIIVSRDVNSPAFLQIDSTGPCRGAAGNANDLRSPEKDFGGNLRIAYGAVFSTGAYVPLGKAVIDTPANLVQLTVTSDRRDRFSLQFDGLGSYNTGKIDTLALWWFQGSLPPAASVDLAHPSWAVPFTRAMQDGGRHLDSLVNSSFVPGIMYYFLASVKGRKEYGANWAPISIARADSEVCYVDRTPPPNLLSLQANPIVGQPNQIRVCWQADASLLSTDADSVGVWYKYSGPPDSATDPNAVRVGIYKLAVSTCTTATGLSQGKRHYFVALIRDSLGNWSSQGANSQAMAETPTAADSGAPVNNLAIHLAPETTGTSVVVRWDKALVLEPKVTVGVTYDKSGFLPIPVNRPEMGAQQPSDSGYVKITGLERGVKYYFALSLADSQFNWAASTTASSDSVQTYVGQLRSCTLFTATPDTVSLAYAAGSIAVGWRAGVAEGSVYEISYFDTPPDTLVRPASPHLRALSHTVYFNKALTVGGFIGSGAFLSIPIHNDSLQAAATAGATTPTFVSGQARLYRFTPPSTWAVVYSSQLSGTNMTAGSLTQGGYYRVMWDYAPPTIVGYQPATDPRRISGVPAYVGIYDTIRISDLAVGNCRGYVRTDSAGRTDADGSRSDTIYQSAEGKIPVKVLSEFITERGYYASLVVTDGVNSVTVDLTFPANFDELRTAPLAGDNKWNFVSFPAELNDPNPTKVFRQVSEGVYDPLKWRLFRYDNALSRYIEAFDPATPTAPTFNIEPGKGYWIVLRSEESGLDVGAGRTIVASKNFRISTGAGWNDFGIPFNFQSDGDSGICLGDIIDSSRGLVTGRYWIYGLDANQSWKPLFNPLNGVHFAGTPLLSWQGYTIYTQTPDALQIPPISRFSSKYRNVTPKQQQVSAEYWGIKTVATWRSGEEAAFVGTNSSAKFFAPRPCRPVEDVSLSVNYETAAGNTVQAMSVCSDTLGIGKTWVLCLKNHSAKAQDITLSFAQEGLRPLGLEAVLLNPAQTPASSILGKSASDFQIILGKGDSLQFKIVAGSTEYVETAIAGLNLPKDFALYSCGPNPFNPVTVIGFDIPFAVHAPHVTLEVRDSRGRLVTTLFSGTAAGRHRKTWDAKGIATGVYYVRMHAADGKNKVFQSVKKLVLLK